MVDIIILFTQIFFLALFGRSILHSIKMQETDGGTISHAWMESRVVNEGYQPGISQEQCRHIHK